MEITEQKYIVKLKYLPEKYIELNSVDYNYTMLQNRATRFSLIQAENFVKTIIKAHNYKEDFFVIETI